MPTNWAGLQARSAPIFTLLSSNAFWTTKLAPAELMFPARKFRRRLPVGVIPRQLDFKELFQHDLEKKMQMKVHTDRKKNVKTLDIQVGDSVMVKQDLSSKASPPYEGEPLEVQHRKGTQLVAKRRDGSTVRRSTAHFRLRRRQADGSWGQILVTSPAQSPRQGSYQGYRNILRKCHYPRWGSQILRTERSCQRRA